MTLLFTHAVCMKHDMGSGHPECPARLRTVLDALSASKFAGLDWREAPCATVEQIARVHPRAHVERILSTIPERGRVSLDPDTSVCPHSGEAALRAAGALVAAVDAIVAGEEKTAFCAVRPPGHHAEPDRAMGFCLFNNVAVGAAHARALYGLERVAVVDFDVHHGNGTQVVFEGDPGLFYASTHQSPLYPGTGRAGETGVGGNISNVPLPPGAGGKEFRRVVMEQVLPALRTFQPDLLFISAGFDAHKEDPLAQMNLTEADYAWITTELKRVAADCCEGRIISTLEGGYHLRALGHSATAHVRALMA